MSIQPKLPCVPIKTLPKKKRVSLHMQSACDEASVCVYIHEFFFELSFPFFTNINTSSNTSQKTTIKPQCSDSQNTPKNKGKIHPFHINPKLQTQTYSCNPPSNSKPQKTSTRSKAIATKKERRISNLKRHKPIKTFPVPMARPQPPPPHISIL